jgi:hypothetical protein
MLSAIEQDDLLLLDPRLVLFPQSWWYPVTILLSGHNGNQIASKIMKIDEPRPKIK